MASLTPFEGHVIAITGAASGIGLATAHYLAVRGATLSLADLQSGPLESASRDIRAITSSARILTTVLDVRDEGQVEAWIARTVNEFGKLSGAANIAGVLGKGFGITDLKDLGTAEWEFIMGVNLTGVFNCLRAELNAIENGGSIVNAASVGGVVGLSKNAAYAASKHAVVGLTRSVAKECKESKVRVNCVCPGQIRTGLIPPETEARGDQNRTAAVFSRKGQPEEVAALFAYLLGDESKFTTGAAYSIDGGWNC
ncbi:hypothetical protein LTR67_002349 [Exophiala xenobiotica]